ncbi:zinc finger, C3HC4 type [Oesophagostomum dentatum]|uniref:Zinc finger, C3HC4 type n=1 Tax=Oesophagostomum dentatum TaxID=61180 RepID=A0A0B1SZ74_OESDE|nr:zinc finger, C3HC4 type [Oesophagostomum dentatum]
MRNITRPLREASLRMSPTMVCSVTQHSPVAETMRTVCTALSIGNQKNKCASDIEHTSSLERRACRICQSESGEMVRPCACAGTMGDIHEACLSRWVAMSNKDHCEICQEKYARSGRTLKALRNWERPRIGSEEILSLILIAALIYCLIYLVYLCEERLFLERMSTLPVRSDDIGRVFVMVVLASTLLASLCGIFRQAKKYVFKQMEIKFVNKSSVTSNKTT